MDALSMALILLRSVVVVFAVPFFLRFFSSWIFS